MVKKNKKTKYWIIGIIIFLILIPVIRYFSLFYGLTFNRTIQIRKASGEPELNVLLMGIGGARHDGPDLTDTIILAHIDIEKKKVDLVSIPRDLWVPALKSKINTAYAFGEERDKKGILLAKNVVANITGQPVDYAFVIDFDGFIKLVDQLGGVDVKVPRTLDDYEYPLEGKENDLCGVEEDALATMSAQIATGSAQEIDFFPCRYEHFHVDTGNIHMDGVEALKYVRSRHGVGAEGSDFARSNRQQLVIGAIRDKTLSLGTILNPVKVFSIINTIRANIHTDIPEDEYDDFIKLAQKIKGSKITSYVIDQGDSSRPGLLVHPTVNEFNGAWVLSPRKGITDFSEIKEYIKCIVEDKVCQVGKTTIQISVE